jgi:hypothetical protein
MSTMFASEPKPLDVDYDSTLQFKAQGPCIPRAPPSGIRQKSISLLGDANPMANSRQASPDDRILITSNARVSVLGGR